MGSEARKRGRLGELTRVSRSVDDGLQETKRDGTSEISSSGYRVFFSGDCTMVKGRKGQHGVGLAIKEEIVKKAGEDGIAIKCISARLLKARISIESYFVTSVVAYAPTEEAPEGQKAKYMAALKCTVASVPAREYVFVLTAANARTGKRGEGGGEADSNVLGAYGRDKLNENGKLLLGFAEDNTLALLNTLFCTPRVACPIRSRAPTATRDKNVWIIS